MTEKKDGQQKNDDGEDADKGKSHNPLEKVVFVAGLIIIAALFGYLGYLIFSERKQPPHLVVTTAYKPNMRDYAYEIRVKNFGEETATSANIKFSLYQEGKVTESGTLTINYVPIKSTETAWIVFHRKRKATDSLVVSSITYLKP